MAVENIPRFTLNFPVKLNKPAEFAAGGASLLLVTSGLRKELSLMFEILFALAAIANVGSFTLQLWEYKQRKRMVKGEEEKAGGNQPL